MDKLGLIAGGGALPATLARHCLAAGRPVFVLRLKDFADSGVAAFDGAEVGLAQLGAAISAFRTAKCRSICMAGTVSRPNFAALRPDARGLLALPGALRASRQGDDALLRFLLHEFEKEGFTIEGAHQVMADLTLPAGPFGRARPCARDLADIDRALQAARAIGALDIGQAAVACEGLILALEAQEGTDAMLARIADLPANIRGEEGRRRGVLAKAAKPGQDVRVDLPTIGPRTVAAVARADLAGIAGETGRLLVLDLKATRALADELGLFVFGAPPPPL